MDMIDPGRRQLGVAIAAAGALATLPKAAFSRVQRRFLPPPAKDAGKPLMQCLSSRRSTRTFAARPLPEQVLSDLLWAAGGINRPTGERTAPAWRHVMAIELYVAMEDGVWAYDPQLHMLRAHLADDLRSLTGTQDFVGTAPVNLIYVANGDLMKEISEEERRLYAAADASFMGQNVYLYCASEGLATVFRGAVDKDRLAAALALEGRRFVTFAQTVGYPA